jgi:hypothetical protein
MNYSASTRNRIADLTRGVKVDTSVLDCSTYFVQNSSGLFNVYGRILLLSLIGEAVTVFDAHAATVKFAFQSTDPVIAVADMGGASASVSALAQGTRFTLQGDAVATAVVLTASAGISMDPLSMMVIGTKGGTGHIEMVTAAADLHSGTFIVSCCYVPYDEGSYVTAAV